MKRLIQDAWVVLLLVGLAGCGSDAGSSNDSLGAALFEDKCAACHKSSGKGDFLKGIPSSAKTLLSKEQVVKLVTQGHQDKPNMPVFAELSQEQAALIADHLLALKQQ